MMKKFNLTEGKDIPCAIIYISEDNTIGISLPFGEDELTKADAKEIQKGLDIIANKIVDIFDRVSK